MADAPKKIREFIPVEGTDISLPCIRIFGAAAGPQVLITAGIHCAEFVGIQAAIELSQELDPKNVTGSVTIITLANPSGFEHRTMSLVYEDGKNLNRVFPGDPAGTAADRIAYTLFEGFIRHADYHIDLHSGDGYEALIPFAYYVGDTAAEERSRQMAECVDAPLCVRSRCLTGGAYNLAAVNGVPSVLIERGQLSRLPREEVEADKRDLCNILRRLGVLQGDHVIYPNTVLREYDLTAPCAGCWYPSKKAGEWFNKGEKLGEIRDYFGNTLHTVTASEDGVILYQTESLNIVENGPMIAYGVK